MTEDDFRTIVRRAALAPSVHNVQPTRWRLVGDTVSIHCDTRVTLVAGDPHSRDAGLSCGAAVAATEIALSELGWQTELKELWAQPSVGTLRPAARLLLRQGGARDGLADQLARRFTHRGTFATEPQPLFGWTRSDAVLVTDRPRIARIAAMNDAASLKIMKDKRFRRELVDWMRFSPRHRRFGIDGMSRDALRMPPATAIAARLVLGPLWGACDLLGLTRAITAEADATVTASVIALFHRPMDESPVLSGRAYLRMWLEATALGLAGWPMAAVADDPQTNAALCDMAGIGAGRRLIQAIRFGKATAPMPPRARRPLDELIV